MVAAASDLGACVCEDDATVSELDDLRARVANATQRFRLAVSPCAECGHIDWRCDPNPLLERAESAEARVRVQAGQIAALQDEAEYTVQSLLPLLPLSGSWESGYRVSDRIAATCVATPEEWATAAHHVAALHAALALAEGCASPADEEEK